MRTLTMNEIEEVGGGPAVVLAIPPAVKAVAKVVAAVAAVSAAAGFGTKAGENLADKAVPTSCPK